MKTTLLVTALATFVAISTACSTDGAGGHGSNGGGGATSSTGGMAGGGEEATGGRGTGGQVATGGSQATGGDGTGGVASTGGAPSSGGASGAGGAAALPGCLQALFAACPTTGACTRESPSPTSTRACFTNGVRTSSDRMGGCQGTGRVVLEVHKADGSLCYTNEVKQGTLCESEQFTWKDGAGAVVATGETAFVGTTVTCAGGETGTCIGNQCALGSVWGPLGTLCQAGSCP